MFPSRTFPSSINLPEVSVCAVIGTTIGRVEDVLLCFCKVNIHTNLLRIVLNKFLSKVYANQIYLSIGTLNNEHRWFNAKDSRLLTGLLSFFGGVRKKLFIII